MAIEIKGLENVLDVLMVDDDKNREILEKACLLVETEAKKRAPKGEGDLKRSIQTKIEDNTTGIVFTPLEYAPYIEFGTGLFAENGGRQDVPWNYKDEKGEWHTTSGMRPQPYMRPALYAKRKEIIKLFGGILDD